MPRKNCWTIAEWAGETRPDGMQHLLVRANAQVAVYLVYAGRRGHAAVERELYIPRSWTCDLGRCRAAGLGEGTVFAAKPELAARMIGRFLDAGHRVSWVAGDEVYGGNLKLRSALEQRQVGYVLAVACARPGRTPPRQPSVADPPQPHHR